MVDTLFTALRLITEVNDECWDLKKPVDLNLAKLLKDAEQRLPFHCCVLCRITLPWPRQTNLELQQHHPAGKVHGKPNHPDTISVCHCCHDYLSDHQRSWLLCQLGQTARLSSYFFGWADIFDLLAYKSGLSYFEKIATRFRAQGYYIHNKLHLSNRPFTADLTIT